MDIAGLGEDVRTLTTIVSIQEMEEGGGGGDEEIENLGVKNLDDPIP